MTTMQTSEPRRVPTIEEFWEIFTRSQLESIKDREKERAEREKERAEREKEREKELAKIAASQKAWKARMKKTERLIKSVSANVGGLNRSMGELIETLIAARLWEKFADYPYNLRRAYQNVPIFNENNGIVTEIDILLSNTEWVMAVEVKHRLNRTDEVDRHIERMEQIRKYPPFEAIGKRMVGAMAGGVTNPDVRDYIHRAGFFVLSLKGESVGLVKPEVEFTPREWDPPHGRPPGSR